VNGFVALAVVLEHMSVCPGRVFGVHGVVASGFEPLKICPFSRTAILTSLRDIGGNFGPEEIYSAYNNTVTI
jgi:hypothetical protein